MHTDHRPERHHLLIAITDIELRYIPCLFAIITIRLHPYLETLIELVEQVYIARSHVSLQRLEDVVHRHAVRLYFGAIDIHEGLRAVVAEGRESQPQKSRLVVRLRKYHLDRLL